MTTQTSMYSALGGIMIPLDAEILSYGQYTAVKNGRDEDAEYALVFDNLIKTLDVNAIKRLAQELTQLINPIKGVSDFHTDMGKPVEMTEERASKARKSPNYRDYVYECSTRAVSMMAVASKISAHRGLKNVMFVFKRGSYYMTIDGERIPEDAIPNYLVSEYNKAFGTNIQLKVDGVLDKVGSTAFKTDVKGESMYKNSQEKVINDVSLREMAYINSLGLFTGTYEINKTPMKMTGTVANYLTSDTPGLRAYYTDKEGVMKSGQEVPGSHEFVKNSFDKYRIGLKKALNYAMATYLGVNLDTEDSKAKEHFILKSAMYKNRIKANESVDVNETGSNRYVLYNPSWLAEEYSRSTADPRSLAEFEEKYAIIVHGGVQYLGHSTYSYVIDTHTYIANASLSKNMKFFKMVPKLVGHYNLIRSFDITLPLDDFLKRFFFKNFHKDIKAAVYYMLDLFLKDYDLTLPFVGVGKNDSNPFKDFDADDDNKSMLDEFEDVYDGVDVVPYDQFNNVNLNRSSYSEQSVRERQKLNASRKPPMSSLVTMKPEVGVMSVKIEEKRSPQVMIEKNLVKKDEGNERMVRFMKLYPQCASEDPPAWSGSSPSMKAFGAWMIKRFIPSFVTEQDSAWISVYRDHKLAIDYGSDDAKLMREMFEACGIPYTEDMADAVQMAISTSSDMF